jgi:alkaline phosphatase D
MPSAAKSLTVGPILGHTTRNRVRFWGRGDDPGKNNFCHAVVQVFDASGQTIVKAGCGKMRRHFDFTGIVDVEGLSSDKEYIYKMAFFSDKKPTDSIQDPVAVDLSSIQGVSFRTAVADDDDEVSFVFGTCRVLEIDKFGDDLTQDHGDKTFKLINQELDDGQRTDCLLMLGDQIYADRGGEICTKLHEYRKRYQLAFTTAEIRKLMSRVPTYMAADDHEIRNNWQNDDMYEGTPSETAEALEIFAAASQAYDSYQFIHSPGFGGADGNGQNRNRIFRRYYDFEVGTARFFIMDTRMERCRRCTPPMIITSEQMEAFKSWLLANKNRLKFVGSAVPFFPDIKIAKQEDRWVGYDVQRKEILDFIVSNRIEKVVFLSGDVHRSLWSTAFLKRDKQLRVHSIVSSAFRWDFLFSPPKFTFDKKGKLKGAKGWRVKDTGGLFDEDNYTRVTHKDGKLRIQIRSRAGKKLADHELTL